MTRIEICNLALDIIGAEGQIVSLDTDTTKEARLCKKHYSASRQTMLTMHPWKFAMVRVVLSPLTNPPAFGSESVFQLPADCLQPRFVNDHDAVWKVEGRTIICNYSQINLVYTADIADETLFHAQFCDALAHHLAFKITYALTQSNDREAAIMKRYEHANRAARFANAVQGSPDHLIADEYIQTRVGPNRGFVSDPMT